MAERPGVPRTTGADVARLAGVSASTVSYVLNNSPRQTIPEATRRRVLEAADRLNYRPSPVARSLRLGRSDVVLGLMPDQEYSPVLHDSFTELAQALQVAGLALVIHPLPADSAAMRELWRTLTPACVFSFTSLAADDVEAMRAAGVQVAVSSAAGQGPRRPWELALGGHDLGRAQVEHLLDRGHRHIGIALPDSPAAPTMASERIAAITESLAVHGHPTPEVWAVPMDAPGARGVLQQWLRRRPDMTAIAAWSDNTGAAVLAAASALGVAVPAELAVIGAYDYVTGRLTTPQLSTVNVDIRAQMQAIAAAIVGALRGDPLSGEPVDASTLIVLPRDST